MIGLVFHLQNRTSVVSRAALETNLITSKTYKAERLHESDTLAQIFY